MKRNSHLCICLALLLLASMLFAVACGKPNEPAEKSDTLSAQPRSDAPASEESDESVSSQGLLGSYSPLNNMFLKLDGIDGDATVGMYMHWIAVTDFSMPSQQPDKYKPDDTYHTFTFSHKLDVATEKIQRAFVAGQWIGTGKLYAVENVAGRLIPVLAVSMEMLRIESVEIGYDATVGAPVETVVVHAEKITWTQNAVNIG